MDRIVAASAPRGDVVASIGAAGHRRRRRRLRVAGAVALAAVVVAGAVGLIVGRAADDGPAHAARPPERSALAAQLPALRPRRWTFRARRRSIAPSAAPVRGRPCCARRSHARARRRGPRP